MPHESDSLATRRLWPTLAILVWSLIVVVNSSRVLFQATPNRTVYPIFAHAGRSWNAGLPIYESKIFWYRYSPAIAGFFGPFAKLDVRVGDFAWRILNAVVFLAGMSWWLVANGGGRSNFVSAKLYTDIADDSDSTDEPSTIQSDLVTRDRNLFWLLLIPLSLASLGNAQANPLILGLLAISTVAVTKGRWNLAAAAIAGATLFKVYPVVLGLLFVVLYPKKFPIRLVVALLGGFAMPFFFQFPEYVATQYAEWLRFIASDARVDWDWVSSNRDVWLLCRRLNLPLNFTTYRFVCVFAGAAVAGLVLLRRRTASDETNFQNTDSMRELANFAFFAGCLWMLIFGPATEACTYILLAPRFASVWLDWREGKLNAVRSWLVISGSAFLFAAEFANFFPGAVHFHSMGPQPLGGLLLFADVLVELATPPVTHSSAKVLNLQEAEAARLSRLDGTRPWANGLAS